MAVLRHPNCDGNHPGREARVGPYDLGQCHLCWLALNDPERVRRLHGGATAVKQTCSPAARPVEEWPWLAQRLAARRREGEAGLGDTVARLIGRLGGEVFKKVYARLVGRDCGCGSRQARLNSLFPY